MRLSRARMFVFLIWWKSIGYGMGWGKVLNKVAEEHVL